MKRKDKAVAGREPTTFCNLSPLCVNMIYHKSYVAEREQETAGQSGVIIHILKCVLFPFRGSVLFNL